MNNQLYKDVSKLTVYSDNEINEMIQKYKDGDESQLSKIIESNLKLIIFYSKQFEKFIKNVEYIEIGDLISEGVFSIKQAVDKFNPDFNVKFSYYVGIWIKKQISEFILNNRNALKIPVRKIKSNSRINKEIEALFQENQNEITRFEIESLNKFSDSEIDFFFNKIEFVDAFEQNIIESEFAEFDDGQEIKEKINYTLKYLTPKERLVIKMLYGIGQEKKSPKEISIEINISKQSISQFKKSALKKIKNLFEKTNNNNTKQN